MKQPPMDFYDILPYAGCPKRLCSTLRDLKDKLKDQSADIEKSAYFHGINGVGKTVLAGHILAQSIQARPGFYTESELDMIDRSRNSEDYDPDYTPNLHQVFCRYPRLLQKIKKTYGKGYEGPSEADLIEPLFETEFLVLDDIGPEMTTDWSYNILYLIISERYDEMLPTIFTSNLSVNELSVKMQDTRIASRIVGMCQDRIFEIVGEDKRIK